MFDAQTYIDRRNRLCKQVQSGLILLLGNDESPMNFADNPYFFRQDSSFLYFFGLDEPGLAGTIDVDEGIHVLFGNDPTLDDMIWMGTGPVLAQRCRQVGVTESAPLDRLGQTIARAKKAGRKIHYLPQYRPKNAIKLFDLLGIDPRKTDESASVELVRAVVEQRSVKTEQEIDELQRAADITAEMHLRAMETARPGMTEAQVVGAVQQVAVASGGNLAFPIILTVNGQTLHNHFHGNLLTSGSLLLHDSGAQTPMGYSGDMSRTFPVDAAFTERQKEIYRVALEAHETAVAALRPGGMFKEIHLEACRIIARGMKDLGFMKGDVEEAVAAGAHALFFPCGLGHMLGLDVHDMESLGEQHVGYGPELARSTRFGLKSLRLARKLEPGFVLTIEPGIYFIPELIDAWKQENKHEPFINYDKVEAYRDFSGLRSEEDFVITETGARLLGKPVPKTIEEIEAVRAR